MTMFTTLFATLALMGVGMSVQLDQAPPKPEFTPVAVVANASDVGPAQSEVVPARQSLGDGGKTAPKPKAIGRTVTVTAYTSEPRQTDDSPCISADNSDICVKYAQGEKICATNDHPMHAKLYIEGYGECTVRDRMNTRYTGTGRVDIYLGMDTPAAYEWGARRVQVSRM